MAYFLKSRAHSRAENKVTELKVEVLDTNVKLDTTTSSRDAYRLQYEGAKAIVAKLNKLKIIIPPRPGEDPDKPVARVVETPEGDTLIEIDERLGASLAAIGEGEDRKAKLILSLKDNLSDTTKTLNKVRTSRPFWALGGFVLGAGTVTAIVIAVN